MGEEWSLVIFTLLAQTSIGMVIVSQLSPAVEHKTAKAALQWAGGIMALSLLVSLTHLGDPLGAYRALANISSSWLSREILFASIYFGLTVVLYQSVAKGGSLRSPLGIAASFFGVLTLISMSFLYAQTSIHAWGTAYTHLTFYGAAAVLGALSLSTVTIRVQPDSEVRLYTKTFSIAAVGAGVQVLSLAPYQAALAAGTAPMQATAKMLFHSGGTLAISQILLVIGAFFFTFMAWNAYTTRGYKASSPWLHGALLAVIVSEIASRYLFYATGIHTMMGRW